MWSQLRAKKFHFSERWEHRGRTIRVARYQVICIKYQIEHRLLHLLCAIPAKVKWDHVETLKYTDPLSPKSCPEEIEPYTSDRHRSSPQHTTAWGFKVKHGVTVRSVCFLKEYRSLLSSYGTKRVDVMLFINDIQGWKKAIGMGWWQEITWAADVTFQASRANWVRACRGTKMFTLDEAFLQTAEELFTCSADCLWPILILRVCPPCSLLWSLSFWLKTQRCY